MVGSQARQKLVSIDFDGENYIVLYTDDPYAGGSGFFGRLYVNNQPRALYLNFKYRNSMIVSDGYAVNETRRLLRLDYTPSLEVTPLKNFTDGGLPFVYRCKAFYYGTYVCIIFPPLEIRF